MQGVLVGSFRSTAEVVLDDMVAVLTEEKSNQDVGMVEFVLDGFGRRVPEVEVGESLTNWLDIWLKRGERFDVPGDLSVDRAISKRTDKMTGQIY